jgi:hypothetical protein
MSMCVFIGISAYTYINIYVYTVFFRIKNNNVALETEMALTLFFLIH